MWYFNTATTSSKFLGCIWVQGQSKSSTDCADWYSAALCALKEQCVGTHSNSTSDSATPDLKTAIQQLLVQQLSRFSNPRDSETLTIQHTVLYNTLHHHSQTFKDFPPPTAVFILYKTSCQHSKSILQFQVPPWPPWPYMQCQFDNHSPPYPWFVNLVHVRKLDSPRNCVI